MKTFKEFLSELYEQDDSIHLDALLEAADDSSKVGGVSNNTKGVLHELLVGHYLNGGKHMSLHPNENGESPKEAHDRLKSQIHPEDYEKIRKRAESAAHDIKTNLKASHPEHGISAVHWTSKPGDTQKVTGVHASQKQDASDIYVTTTHKTNPQEKLHHGISLKVSDKSSKNVPSSSLGMESSGSTARELFKTHQDKIKNMYPDLASVKKEDRHKDAKDARKEWATKNPEKHSQIKKENAKLLKAVADSHAKELQHKLNSGDHEHVINHIRDVLGARRTPAQEEGKATYQKHTTYETSKGTQHHASNPGDDYEHILNHPERISVKSSGTSTHFYYRDPKTGFDKKFASQSHKFDSQSDPLSTLKSAGKSI